MIAINVRNVNEGLSTALHRLITEPENRSSRPSRNGPVISFNQPVATTYSHPMERVLFSNVRNANPTFHLLESLWMLAGRNDVEFPATFVRNMRNFSDDRHTFWGAYGYRWRNFFGWNQIQFAIEELKANPSSRRVVLSMWNAMDSQDGGYHSDPDFIVGQNGGKDVPCNTHIYLDIRDGNLNMTVCCRSNDMIWGCYGANAVHMSFLQEYIARHVGVPVGWYTQMSNDLHLYTDVVSGIKAKEMSFDVAKSNMYLDGIEPTPIITKDEQMSDFDDDLDQFFEIFDTEGVHGLLEGQFTTDFFGDTVQPMVRTWLQRKTPIAAGKTSLTISALDWGLAMELWIKNNHAVQGGVK